MTAATTIITYLSEGTHAARPATPNLPTGGLAMYYETDTFNTFLYDLNTAAWVQINGAQPSHYSSTYFSQTTQNASFATIGSIFVPDQNITIEQVEAWLKPASSGLQVEFSIVSLNAGGLVINTQLYVSPSAIVTSGTSWIKVSQKLASPLALTAGTAYAILLTGTSLAGGTTALPIGTTTTSFGTAVAHDGWLNMPKQQIPGSAGGAGGDVITIAEFASNTPPTSGTLTNTDTAVPNIMVYWHFTGTPP